MTWKMKQAPRPGACALWPGARLHPLHMSSCKTQGHPAVTSAVTKNCAWRAPSNFQVRRAEFDPPRPHIYSDQEIEELLAAARRLGPPTSIRGLLYETLFGLLACTGLRISEALALRLADVDLQQGVLTVRRTKFGKSRAVPLHPSTTQALRAYRAGRDLTGAGSGEDEHLFIGLRADILGKPLAGHQARLVFAGLRRELGWVNRGTHHAARIHDLRHTFVVRRVLLWQLQGVDVDRTMLSLSTYLGHAGVADTYWYLQAVPDLMAVAAQRFEACMPEVCDA